MASESEGHEPDDGAERSSDHGGQRDMPMSAGSSKHTKDEANRRSLFVRSLPASATTDSLTKLFSESYPLKHAVVISDPTTNLSKGYGFVTFTDSQDALAALKAFDGAVLDGKRIKTELAEPRSRNAQSSDQAKGSDSQRSLLKRTRTKEQQDQKGVTGEVSTQLIVRNLPWTINNSDQLTLLFRSYGKIKKATMPQKEHGLSAGFGFVMLRGRKNAEKALKGVNGKIIDGRTLAVDWAVRKDMWQSMHPTLSKSNSRGVSAPLSVGDAEIIDDETSNSELPHKLTNGQGDVGPDAGSPLSSANDDDSDDDGDQGVGDDPADPDLPRGEQDESSTLFIRNVPFTATDESLYQHFTSFGPVRYARVVVDPSTQRPRGTAFVCFWNEADSIDCLRTAPRAQSLPQTKDKGLATSSKQTNKKSLLEDVNADASGRFTIDGRALQISRAVDKGEATRLTAAGHSFRDLRDRDKRRLYLLSEGTIPSNTPLYDQLAPAEIALREQSAKQRQNLIKNNPALHMSLTRLSVRNLPPKMNSKTLKALAREAVVGFSSDVKAGRRQALSREEVSRAGDTMREAERARKLKGKGIVKQSKVIFESNKASKVSEGSGAGRSKGYGFIEYTSHRCALMGLRWLNGHVPTISSTHEADAPSTSGRKKRLIVEFAIENAQVVGRRQDRETRSLSKTKISDSVRTPATNAASTTQPARDVAGPLESVKQTGQKRKRAAQSLSHPSPHAVDDSFREDTGTQERLAKKQKIIGRKRMSRRVRKSA
ncbi:MAG: hypothetical protein Q9174_001059 [Haloplaca sp. 1 TL-2023]